MIRQMEEDSIEQPTHQKEEFKKADILNKKSDK
jgi:hypothetical protein